MRSNNWKIFKSGLLIFIAVLFLQVGFAQPAITKDQYAKRLEQWKKLSPEERKTILANYKKYTKLPAPEKKIVQQNFQEWQELPLPEKEKIKIEVKNFERLPKLQREMIVREKRSPAEIREMPRDMFKERQSLPKKNRDIEANKGVVSRKYPDMHDKPKGLGVKQKMSGSRIEKDKDKVDLTKENKRLDTNKTMIFRTKGVKSRRKNN
jgi:hypothetical protein